MENLLFIVGLQVNTHGYVDGEGAARAALLCTRRELDAFYESDPDGNRGNYRAALEKYGEAFFEGKALLLLVREENSGSISLRVKSVALANGILEVQIARSAPEFGTCDMARWVLGIELDSSFLPAGDVPVRVTYY